MPVDPKLQAPVKDEDLATSAHYENVAALAAFLGVAALAVAGWLIWAPLCLIVVGVALLFVARFAAHAAVGPAPAKRGMRRVA